MKKLWLLAVPLAQLIFFAPPAQAQAKRNTTHYVCWILSSGQYYYSGPIHNFSLLRPEEMNQMRHAFAAEVSRRYPGFQGVRDNICRSEGARSSAEKRTEKIVADWLKSSPDMVGKVHLTGWTHDFVTGAAAASSKDPSPAVRIVAPGETPKPSQPQQAQGAEDAAARRAVQGAYASQQQRDQARIDKERAEKAAYERALANTRRAEAEYRDRLAKHNAAQAEYEKQKAEWQARVARCKSGDSKSCSGQAIQLD